MKTTRVAFSRPTPKPKPEPRDRRKKTLKISEALSKELDLLARSKGWTTTRLVTKILEEFVGWANKV